VDDPQIGEILVEADELQRRVAELGAEINRDYEGRDLVMIGVLKGAVMFLADLMRELDIPCEIDFMAVSSYGNSSRTSGTVRLVKDLDIDIAGRDVLLVEDIVDTGLTLRYLRRSLQARRPASLEVVTLLARETADLDRLGVRYVGFTIGSDFVIGYGLDVDQRYRNLDVIARYDRDGDPLASPVERTWSSERA
jgi:hypoxanthine phosphoribosyltransferase